MSGAAGPAILGAGYVAVKEAISHRMRTGAKARRVEVDGRMLFGNTGYSRDFISTLEHFGHHRRRPFFQILSGCAHAHTTDAKSHSDNTLGSFRWRASS